MDLVSFSSFMDMIYVKHGFQQEKEKKMAKMSIVKIYKVMNYIVKKDDGHHEPISTEKYC